MLIERRPAGIFSVASVPTASCTSPLSRPPSRLSTLIADEYFPRADVITAGTLRGSRIRRYRRCLTTSRSGMGSSGASAITLSSRPDCQKLLDPLGIELDQRLRRGRPNFLGVSPAECFARFDEAPKMARSSRGAHA